MKRALLSWSGGKDSAFCLHRVLQQGAYDVTRLMTTLSSEFRRISMHGIREELLDAQAEALQIPLSKMWVSEATNEHYEKQLIDLLASARAEGIEHVIFGDIFLEDLRQYRERQLAQVGMKAIFPLWNYDTTQLIRDFTAEGFRSMICCTDDRYFGDDFAGTLIEPDFLEKLPKNVDPCGENGEFHSFCFAGPVFQAEIPIRKGEQVHRSYSLTTEDGQELKTGFQYQEILLNR